MLTDFHLLSFSLGSLAGSSAVFAGFLYGRIVCRRRAAQALESATDSLLAAMAASPPPIAVVPEGCITHHALFSPQMTAGILSHHYLQHSPRCQPRQPDTEVHTHIMLIPTSEGPQVRLSVAYTPAVTGH